MDNVRKQFLMTLTDYEKTIFTEQAKKYKWSIGKFLRVASKMFILLNRDKSLTFSDAMQDAVRHDSNTNLEL